MSLKVKRKVGARLRKSLSGLTLSVNSLARTKLEERFREEKEAKT